MIVFAGSSEFCYTVDCIGVDHEGTFCILEEILESVHSGFLSADAGAYCYCLMVVVHTHVADVVLVAVGFIHHFGDCRLQDVESAAGAMHGAEACAGTHHCFGAHHGGACHAGAACEEERGAVVALAGEWIAATEKRRHVARVDYIIICGRVFDFRLVEVDVEEFPLAEHIMVFGKEETEAGELEGKREMGVHHVADAGLGVPFAEESGGDVD